MTEERGRLRVIRPGRLPYDEALDLQMRLERQRIDGEIPDTVVILEHPPVITLGHRGLVENVVASPEELEARGIVVRRTSRGGDVTYHGPGQVVMYPIVDLRAARMGAARFVELLEECMIRVCRSQGVEASRLPKKRGVFVGRDKVGAVGIHISRDVTTHGLALNVDPDMRHFDLVVSCGLRDHGVTSLARAIGRPVDREDVERGILASFAELLGRRVDDA